MQISELFDKPQNLPAIPKVVQELINSFNDENVSIDTIANSIASDPVLSAKFLKMANSAYYQLSRSVSTVKEAMMMLGFITVRTIVISSGLMGGYKAIEGMDLKSFWRYSLQTAAYSRWLAKRCGQESPDQAFTVGLMHAIGQLIMHSAMSAKMAEIDKICDPIAPQRLELEAQHLGYDFATVGAELARQWNFPIGYIDAIEHFPSPMATLRGEAFDSVAAVLNISVWLARHAAGKVSDDQLLTYLNEEEGSHLISRLNISPEQLLADIPPVAELTQDIDALLN